MNWLLCKIFGHKFNPTCDWGFGFNGMFDVWCKRCDKMESFTVDELKSVNSDLYYKARKRINDTVGIDVSQQ